MTLELFDPENCHLRHNHMSSFYDDKECLTAQRNYRYASQGFLYFQMI